MNIPSLLEMYESYRDIRIYLGKALLIESLHTSQVAHQAGAYPGFCSMKGLGVFLLLLGCNASPSIAGLPPALSSPVPIYKPRSVERGTVKVKCLALEHNVPGQGSNSDSAFGDEATAHPTKIDKNPSKVLNYLLNFIIMSLFKAAL